MKITAICISLLVIVLGYYKIYLDIRNDEKKTPMHKVILILTCVALVIIMMCLNPFLK